jgi:hypothetical protein
MSTSLNEEDYIFYDLYAEDFTLWKCFLFSLWSHYVFVCKLCDILQTLTTWLAKSMKKFGYPLPTTLEFQLSHPSKPKTLSQKLFFKLDLEGPSTLKPIEHKLSCKHTFCLLPRFVD